MQITQEGTLKKKVEIAVEAPSNDEISLMDAISMYIIPFTCDIHNYVFIHLFLQQIGIEHLLHEFHF